MRATRLDLRYLGCAAAAFAVAVLSGCSTTEMPVSSTDASTQGVLALQGAAGGAGGLQVVRDLPPPINTHNGQEQPLALNDVLEVDVFQADSLDRTVQIDAAGRVNLPLIGAVDAAGKSVRTLEQEIEAAYGRNYLQNPDVTIFLKESFGQRVTIDGEVTKAGVYPVTSSSTLLETVALAGGFRPLADQSKVFVYRDIGSQKLVANFDVAEIRTGKRANPRIYGGDVVIVFTSQSKIAMQNLKEALGIATSASRLAIIP
ncbi:polysaccharide biosynthesis/export family protein [Aquibium sp. ELW1220]|uniref:polysaccharide biosynthesis/export family protein n=1 Tax=Aquibium sp. ELW1220 TaxID=2976766 RepID=UPI0025B0AD33|nr:polysaccharide biosynthesis/export family protein [Aquibium sp. ELW1220]MDN2583037.1 polysaccharide export protein [Aquibium sp. ELW1220]